MSGSAASTRPGRDGPRAGEMTPAPFLADIANAPEEARAFWLTTPRGLRLRMAHLGRGEAGTVLIFPGRTEYAEKYGPAARVFAEAGFGSVAVDWQGQGLADRFLPDTATGHVDRFATYQDDVDAVLAAVTDLGLPGPFYLVGHSMGGCIGLRALHRGLPVAAAAFSAPMWGIGMPPHLRPAAWLISGAGGALGFGGRYAPGTSPESFLANVPYEGNTLTSDREQLSWLQSHLTAHPELSLGGPSLTWLLEALREMRALRRLAPPRLPCLTWVGSNERIVDPAAIRETMARWPGGRLHVAPGGEHELMMERPEIRDAFFEDIIDHFSRHRPAD
ncbi:alpha/beta hydrolase [Roseicyclus sp. F158]|uniref:Alpha/beta hydrolase n=1 Tax=Tropicimonas omnivorans TaxID=3075590 RepID=A0ABU3DDX7_9RHOB|nr:alpha/beta hydrolase [Roseicyclus sp. F158]MDT0681916.1 alpha/beta hydrolase [Roseicyclus sp. F158]